MVNTKQHLLPAKPHWRSHQNYQNCIYQHGLLLLAQHDLSGADAALSRSTRLDPNQFNTCVMQAHLAIARGALDEAEQLSRTAATHHFGSSATTGRERHNHTASRTSGTRALAMLSQAVELLPEEPAVLFSLGFAYLQKGHIAFAERAFQRVIELNLHVIPVRALIAQLAQRQGRLDDALRILEEALICTWGDTPRPTPTRYLVNLSSWPETQIEHCPTYVKYWQPGQKIHAPWKALLTAQEAIRYGR